MGHKGEEEREKGGGTKGRAKDDDRDGEREGGRERERLRQNYSPQCKHCLGKSRMSEGEERRERRI